MSPHNFHGSCVCINTSTVLIRGPSGSGKSDLVLRLIDEERGAMLVADDQVLLTAIAGKILVEAPLQLKGLLEVRGQGIVKRPHIDKAMLTHIIDLTPIKEIIRMPEAHDLQTQLLGLSFPRLKLDPSQASATARIRAFLKG